MGYGRNQSPIFRNILEGPRSLGAATGERLRRPLAAHLKPHCSTRADGQTHVSGPAGFVWTGGAFRRAGQTTIRAQRRGSGLMDVAAAEHTLHVATAQVCAETFRRAAIVRCP